MPEFQQGVNLFKKKVILHTPGGAAPKSFVLYHEPNASKSLVRSIGTDCAKMSLTECIGHGASGQGFIGTTDNESTLSKLHLGRMQNRCCGKKLVSMRFCQTSKDDAYQKSMDSSVQVTASQSVDNGIYIGHNVGNISDLNPDQWCTVSAFKLQFFV